MPLSEEKQKPIMEKNKRSEGKMARENSLQKTLEKKRFLAVKV